MYQHTWLINQVRTVPWRSLQKSRKNYVLCIYWSKSTLAHDIQWNCSWNDTFKKEKSAKRSWCSDLVVIFSSEKSVFFYFFFSISEEVPTFSHVISKYYLYFKNSLHLYFMMMCSLLWCSLHLFLSKEHSTSFVFIMNSFEVQG